MKKKEQTEAETRLETLLDEYMLGIMTQDDLMIFPKSFTNASSKRLSRGELNAHLGHENTIRA